MVLRWSFFADWLRRAFFGWGLRARRRSDADFSAGRDRQLTRHHDLLAARHTRRHHHVVALTLTERDWPELDGLIRLDDVDERPFLTDLRRLTRDQHRRSRSENQLDVDEVTRPEMEIGVP